MSWNRPNNWNGAGQFQYDSADLPFQPPSNNAEAGCLESGSPFWKHNNFSEVDKVTNTNGAMGKEQYQSTMIKLFSVANSFSQEDLSSINRSQSAGDRSRQTLSVDSAVTAEDFRRMTQSLPATPLTTPGSTPAPTPGPTPQSSPLIQRKIAAELSSPASVVVNNTSPNNKWYYLGFFPPPTVAVTNNGKPANWIASVRMDGSPGGAGSGSADKLKSIPNQDAAGPQSCRRKCAPLISNRDVNFFAPTSM